MSETLARTRTYNWQDPMIGAKIAPTMSGLEYMRAIVRGEIPRPLFVTTLGMEVQEVEEGRVVFSIVPADFHYNPIGVVHGGVACTPFDSAMGCAVQTTLPVGVTYTTLELKVNLVRPLTKDTGQVFCEGKVIYVGGRVATAEARLTDSQGKLYGHATTTCMIFR